MDLLGHLDTLQKTLVAVATVAGVLFAFWRKARPWWKAGKADIAAIKGQLLGRDAIHDPVSGRELSPAQPGVGVLVEEIRQQMPMLTRAISQLADQHVIIEDHERRIKVVEAGVIERVVTKAESTAAWQAVEAVAKAVPPTEPKPDDDHPRLPGLGEN